MTVFVPNGGTVPPPGRLSRSGLTLEIAARRALLAELEAEMIAACEAAVLGATPRPAGSPDPQHWDRGVWQRYLAAAMRLEPVFGPRMCRLRREIGQLERLLELPVAA